MQDVRRSAKNETSECFALPEVVVNNVQDARRPAKNETSERFTLAEVVVNSVQDARRSHKKAIVEHSFYEQRSVVQAMLRYRAA